MTTILLYFTVLVILLLIFRKPYLGVVFTVASLPVADILPKIPGLSSVVPLFGVATILAYLLQSKKQVARRIFRFPSILIIELVFIGWMFFTNPEAAWFGRDRNWLFTYLQLWMLSWLAGLLLDTPRKQQTLMWIYLIFAIFSAYFAIQSGNTGTSISLSTRSAGLAQGANDAARYFIIAMIFSIYIRISSSKRWERLLATGGVIITILGVFFTVSRTGFLLLVAAFVLMLILHPQIKYRSQLLAGFIILLVGVWFFSDSIVSIVNAIAPAVEQGTDTIGFRFQLWKAGWRMWQAYPVAGVGIGRYLTLIYYYNPEVFRIYHAWSLPAHSLYIELLAETGIIGLALFISLIIKTIQNFWRGGNSGDHELILLRNAWFTVFVIMLLGGVTKSDQADKLIWLTMGVSIFFDNQWMRDKEKKTLERKQDRSVIGERVV